MTDSDVPPSPAVFDERGAVLWKSIHEQHPEMTDSERELVVEACRVADRLDRLDVLCRSEPPVVMAKTGPIANPAYAEARQQQNLLRQIVATLRMPDAKTGARPQTRPARGTHASPMPAGVSSLDRARAARAI